MDTKTIVIAVVLIALLWLGGFFPSAQASTSTVQTPASAPQCYSQASGVVSPGWAGMNRLQRAYVAMAVIADCEAVR